jgi:hypothetical protein
MLVESPCCTVYVCVLMILHDVDSTVGNKLIASSFDSQNVSG